MGKSKIVLKKMDTELDAFRDSWRRELLGGCATTASAAASAATQADEALALQLDGMALEEQGDLAGALVQYKRAARLEPGIDVRASRHFRAEDAAAAAATVAVALAAGSVPSKQQRSAAVDVGNDDDNDDADGTVAAAARAAGIAGECVQFVAEPERPVEHASGHISALPADLLVNVFVSLLPRDRDLAPLGTLARVCKQWCAVLGDPRLWAVIGRIAWGPDARVESPWFVQK
jgi:hypothetical protein